MRHATPDTDQTDVIDRGGTSRLPAASAPSEAPTGQLPAEIRPVVACPFHGHQAAWRWVRRIALVLAYATLGVWAWGLFLAAWVLHGLSWP